MGWLVKGTGAHGLGRLRHPALLHVISARLHASISADAGGDLRL
jgi:hypothetical protein